MIAADTSVIIPWLDGAACPETERLAELLAAAEATVSPSTITELYSDPAAGAAVTTAIVGFQVLPILDGYWERAGRLRAALRAEGRKAGFADALIAQSCIDADISLLTRDKDFAVFAKIGGLKLHTP